MLIPTVPPPLKPSQALFLDFDGTLVPLAATPQAVRVPAWVRPTLARLQVALQGALAIVSGRPLEQIDAFLHPLHLWGAGAHGAQWRGPAGQISAPAVAPPEAVQAVARDLVAAHLGLLLEVKPGGFALHYRHRPELAATCLTTLRQALRDSGPQARGWELMQGHCVVEVKLQSVSKGLAVRAFLTQPPFQGREPVFVGDDVTDEQGIEAVQALGGYGVRVGPGASMARHGLNDTDAVARWLSQAAADVPHPSV